MTTLPEQEPAAAATTPIAGFWRRIAALAIDLLILGVPTFLLGLALFHWFEALGQAGRLVGFVLALLYFGLMNSCLGGGQTMGKRILGIRVIDRGGHTLSPPRSIARFLVIAVPYFLNGLWFDLDPLSTGPLSYLLGVLLVFVVFGGLGAISYLYVFNRRTRQSLHDLAVGSFVVRNPGRPIPGDIFVPRLHLIVAGCWLVVALIGPMIGIWAIYRSDLPASMKPVADLQTAIKTRLDLQQVRVETGSTTFTGMRSGSSTTSYLQVNAQPGMAAQDNEALTRLIAGVVLDLHPDLLGRQMLIVSVQRRFDLGIASWNVSHREALDAAAWRERLAHPPTRPGS